MIRRATNKGHGRWAIWMAACALAVTAGLHGAVGAQQGSKTYTDETSIETAVAENLARVEHAQSRTTQIEAEVASLRTQREEAEVRLHERARALYRVRRSGMLPVAGGFDALLRHLARVQRLSRMVKADMETMAFLEERGAALHAEKNQLATALQQANATLRTLDVKKNQMRESQRSASLLKSTFNGTRRDEPSKDSLAYGRIRLSGGGGDLETGFSQMRGELALPVQGARRIGNGEREGASGVEFYGRPGASVRAAADGRVAYAREYGEYGQMIVIDHGESFYTVYGGLGQTEVQTGDWVGMSARIGELRYNQEEPVLFFEVRRGTRNMDARSWLGL